MRFHNTHACTSKLHSIVFCNNLKTNAFAQFSFLIISHLPSAFHRHILSFFLSRFSTLRSIPTLLINKSYPGFLLLAVSSERLTSYLTAGTRRRRPQTWAVFHPLVFIHAEINFVHFPFPVARRRRGHRDKAALSHRHAY